MSRTTGEARGGGAMRRETSRFWVVLSIVLVVQVAALSCGVGFHPDPYHTEVEP